MPPPRPASVVFVCHDGSGRILLARRSAGARDQAGRWDCGAGAIEPGEQPDDAVRREVGEEYAAVPLELHRLGDRRTAEWDVTVYAVRLDPDEVRNGEPHKLAELGWFDPTQLPAPLHPELPGVLALYLAG